MIKHMTGSIINVSSSIGRAAPPRWRAYAVSKYGLEGFTQILGEELKPFNIRVNPGPLVTQMRRVVHPRGGSDTIAQTGTGHRHLYLSRVERSKEIFRTVV